MIKFFRHQTYLRAGSLGIEQVCAEQERQFQADLVFLRAKIQRKEQTSEPTQTTDEGLREGERRVTNVAPQQPLLGVESMKESVNISTLTPVTDHNQGTTRRKL